MTLIPSDIVKSLSSMQYLLEKENNNPRICQILNQTVLNGGKRLRPMLTLLMGNLFNLDHEQVIPYACAIERVHAATLAHDDVVDTATSRRGQPSINAVSSNKKAILAGDYLLAKVLFDVASRGDNRVVQGFAKVIEDLVEGEWLQIENTKQDTLSWQNIEHVARKKTGSVLRWCCTLPALLSEADDAVVTKCEHFGEILGIAFQIGDDILDFTREDMAQGADLRTGTISSVIYELQHHAEQTPDTLEKALKAAHQRRLDYTSEAQLLIQEIYEQVTTTPSQRSTEALECLLAMLNYLNTRS